MCYIKIIVVNAIILIGLMNTAKAQQDSIKKSFPDIFQTLSSSLKNYQLDTSDVPNDKITKAIIELRKLRAGFNVNEMIEYKIGEDRSKNDSLKEQLNQYEDFITKGNGRRWLDNAVIWMYRKEFSYSELKQIIKFYKTSAGQKMASSFPLLMAESVKAADMITEMYKQKHK